MLNCSNRFTWKQRHTSYKDICVWSAGTKKLPAKQLKVLTSKFSKPKMSRMPMDLKFSFPLIFWLILRMIQEKHWEYNAMATESRESTACNDEREARGSVRVGVWVCQRQRSIKTRRINVCVHMCVCADLLYSEWRANFLSSEDYGALSQDFRQLEGIQAQQLTGISDH